MSTADQIIRLSLGDRRIDVGTSQR
jgi:hypothetical protein